MREKTNVVELRRAEEERKIKGRRLRNEKEKAEGRREGRSGGGWLER